jgi:hypothetical protein
MIKLLWSCFRLNAVYMSQIVALLILLDER